MEDYQIIFYSDGEVEIIDNVAGYVDENDDFDPKKSEENIEEDLKTLEELRIMLENN